MVHSATIDEFFCSSAWIFQDVFNGVKKPFIGMQKSVLQFISNIFSVDTFVFFLSAIGAKISLNLGRAVFTGFSHFCRYLNLRFQFLV